MEQPSDSPFIYPAVKAAAAWLAGFAALLALLCAAGALLEIGLAQLAVAQSSLSWLNAAIFCGTTSQLCLSLLTSALALLTPWCHQVLLAGRGNALTQWLAWFGALIALPVAASALVAAATRVPLLPGQLDLQLLILVLLLAIAAFNLPRMAAAPAWMRAALVASPALLIGALITDAPLLLPYGAGLKVLAAALLFLPLRRLRRFAPRIIGMPERDGDAPSPTHN